MKDNIEVKRFSLLLLINTMKFVFAFYCIKEVTIVFKSVKFLNLDFDCLIKSVLFLG